jgi:hypothetical protein
MALGPKRGSVSYHGTPKLGAKRINHPTWSSDIISITIIINNIIYHIILS